jgi:hypothetical protein
MAIDREKSAQEQVRSWKAERERLITRDVDREEALASKSAEIKEYED